MRTVRWVIGLAALGVPILFLWQFQLFAAGHGVQEGLLPARPPEQPQPTSFGILIDAVLYDGYALNDADEAVRLVNLTTLPMDLTGWRLSDGSTTVELPAGAHVPAGGTAWIARDGAAFSRQFGFLPDIITTGWPGFANHGDEVVLNVPDGRVADGLVYGDGNIAQAWWWGPAVQPYTAGGLFAVEGQILFRRSDPGTGQRLPDSDSQADWAQTPGDVLSGRKVQYPGWELDRFFVPLQVTETAVITLGVAPDNALAVWLEAIAQAEQQIHIESLTFEHAALASALAAAARRGVDVSALLEGDPPGGLEDQERWACLQLEMAGGACWFMIRDDDATVHDRYRYLHAKFMVVDSKVLVVSSENLSPYSLPDDDKSDGTWGRRGIVVATNAPQIVARAEAIFADDLAPAAHADLQRWQAGDLTYGAPPPGYRPITVTGGVTYSARFSTPAVFQGVFPLEIVQAPESSLHEGAGVMALLQMAGDGDEILVEQLSEPAHWGGSDGTAESDPNPRLEAMLAAARRGARVRLLLDSFFDDGANAETCAVVNAVALSERLNLACARANPTGLGLHNKMILVRAGGRGWVHVGSLNGTELAHKGNRELALQIQSDALHTYLSTLFVFDWPHRLYLPVVALGAFGPPPHVLISEVVYDPARSDAAEFIELVNPLRSPFDLGNWRLGDAVLPDDFEDMRIFPEGTVVPPESTLVVAFSARDFVAAYGRLPDFEIYNSDPLIPDLLDDPAWGDPAALLQLGNTGDEVLLRDPAGVVVDVVAYGSGSHPQVISCPLLSAFGHSLERYPFWRDSDNCPADFRDWPLPGPGLLPK